MYVYDSFDQALVDQRVDEFRDQVARRLAGELTEDQFRPLRLMNGLYLQLHAYMLRVAIPYGTLSADQMRALADIADTYDRGYGHFTTRQNIQFNWIKLNQAPDVLADLAAAQLHAIQTSGNVVRNVTADHFAGVTADEVDDPRVTAEILRQWSTLHPEFSFLPRKFKIAVIASAADRAAMRFHDIGLRVVRLSDGGLGYDVYVGGGMGRTPFVAPLLKTGLPAPELLSYLEAIMRVYNRYGRRDNIYKARIKILVNDLGVEKFASEVETEWADLRTQGVNLPAAEETRIRRFFALPGYDGDPAGAAALAAARAADPVLDAWARTNLHPHKVAGFAIVTVSLKPFGGIPGDATSAQMRAVADIADRFSLGEIRVTHEQNLVLPHVRAAEVPQVFTSLVKAGLGTPNAGLISDIIACPGLDYCALANARSIPVAQRISERFADLATQHDIGPLKIKISGCINSCGHHHAGHIGILGVEKNGAELYQIMLGGSGAEDAAIGGLLGPGFTPETVVDAVATVVATYVEQRRPGETFLAAVRRLGPAPFKERLYGPR
ncbi:MAG: nitrite/sulfite reductase [Rhodospirillaceae bacterium]|nr:nitrite/sulfite reductase [Rhodospirillaceae bacterium]